MGPKQGEGTPSSMAGFSVVESLIAALILLIIALGIIPLFARALRDNTTGADATQATNHGRASLEEYQQLPFNNQALTLAPGATTLTRDESWAQGTRDTFGDDDEGWWPGAPSDRGLLLWTRTTTVRQFGINDIQMPCTPERVWTALQGAGSGAATVEDAMPHFEAEEGQQ